MDRHYFLHSIHEHMYKYTGVVIIPSFFEGIHFCTEFSIGWFFVKLSINPFGILIHDHCITDSKDSVVFPHRKLSTRNFNIKEILDDISREFHQWLRLYYG